MTTTPRTVHAVLTKILAPVRLAAAGSPTALDLHESLPGFTGDGVCGVAVASFDEPWTSAFFDDGTRFGVAGDGLRRSGPSPGSIAEVLGLALTRLPPRPPSPGGIYLDADERGVLEPGQECLVGLLEELRRPRLGTVQLDIVRGSRRLWEVVAFVDDDKGRHLAVLGKGPGGRRRFWWLPGSVDRLAEFVEGRVPEHV